MRPKAASCCATFHRPGSGRLPKSDRLDPWRYDRALYTKHNEIERLFRRLQGYWRIFSRFEKLADLFLGFLSFAFIVEGSGSVNTP